VNVADLTFYEEKSDIEEGVLRFGSPPRSWLTIVGSSMAKSSFRNTYKLSATSASTNWVLSSPNFAVVDLVEGKEWWHDGGFK
jgi:hypothetical protein